MRNSLVFATTGRHLEMADWSKIVRDAFSWPAIRGKRTDEAWSTSGAFVYSIIICTAAILNLLRLEDHLQILSVCHRPPLKLFSHQV